jgi:hypothetical protein
MKTVRSQLSFWMGLAMPVPACATAVWAHPGHSLTQARVGHLFSSPDHATVLVGIGVLLYILSGLVSRQKIRRTLQWSAFVMLAAPLVVREI